MSNIATTIEQSKELVRLGLDPKTADMFWMDTNGVKPCLKLMDDGIFNHRNYLVRFPNSSLPAWSLSALLEVMPKMEADSTVWLGCVSTLIRCKSHDFMWQHDSTAAQPITAAYEMVCWLLEQGLIKKGGKQ